MGLSPLRSGPADAAATSASRLGTTSEWRAHRETAPSAATRVCGRGRTCRGAVRLVHIRRWWRWREVAGSGRRWREEAGGVATRTTAELRAREHTRAPEGRARGWRCVSREPCVHVDDRQRLDIYGLPSQLERTARASRRRSRDSVRRRSPSPANTQGRGGWVTENCGRQRLSVSLADGEENMLTSPPSGTQPWRQSRWRLSRRRVRAAASSVACSSMSRRTSASPRAGSADSTPPMGILLPLTEGASAVVCICCAHNII